MSRTTEGRHTEPADTTRARGQRLPSEADSPPERGVPYPDGSLVTP